MNKFIASAAIAGAIGFSAITNAAPLEIFDPGDFPAASFADIIASTDFSEGNVLMGLQAIAAGQTLPAPTPVMSNYSGGPIAAGDYLVLYYSGPLVQPGNTTLSPVGGGFEIFYFSEAAGGFSVPATGEGPAGPGELIFARLYDHVGVPDGGSTLALFGIGLVCTAFARRR